jgi:RNA polymerase sigma-70 factor (ECF subfamily)
MEPNSEDNRSLVARIAAGDREAADTFDALFRGRLLRFAQSRRVPNQDHNDLVQDVLFAAFRSIQQGGYREAASLGTWLIGILNHKIADYWEHHQRERDRLVPIGSSAASTIQADLDRVSGSQAAPDNAIEVREILGTLPKEHRVVLLLNLTEGWTTEEIAALLKMRPGTVGRILWEAKRMLREKGLSLKKVGSKGD